MARPQDSKRPATGNQLASLSSEVLRLRLQALNLPVRGSRQQLITRLRSALKSQAARAGRAIAVRPGRSTRRKDTHTASTSAQPTALTSEQDSVSEGNSLSMADGSPSVDNLLSLPDRPALPSAVGSVPSPVDTPFSDSQLRVLQQTVQMAVQNARFQQDNVNELHYSSPPVRPTGMASPLGLQRPLDRSLEEKILRAHTMAKGTAPLLTPPVAPRVAPVHHTVSTLTSPVDVPVSPASSSTCAAAAALQPTLLCDAAPVAQRTPPSLRSPATTART